MLPCWPAENHCHRSIRQPDATGPGECRSWPGSLDSVSSKDVEEPTLLRSVNRIVGRIDIQHDLLRRAPVSPDGMAHEQPVRSLGVHHYLLVAARRVRIRRRQVHPVERAAPRQRLTPVTLTPAALTTRVKLAHSRCEQRVVA